MPDLSMFSRLTYRTTHLKENGQIIANEHSQNVDLITTIILQPTTNYCNLPTKQYRIFEQN
jgi:hypothetical protein